MANLVNPGDRILASQYNALVGAVKGPVQPSPNVPFTQTADGTVYNGGNNAQVRNPHTINPLFNISTGCGAIDNNYNGWEDDNSVFNGVWTQLADWRNTLSYLYHDNFLTNNTTMFLIDPTSTKGQAKLIQFPKGTMGKDVKWPICELSSQAGIAVFQLLEKPTDQDNLNGTCAIFIGDFSLFDSKTGSDGQFPDTQFYPQYLAAIKQANNRYNKATKIALRHAVPLYVAPYYTYVSPDDPMATPVAWTVGQQHIEALPDVNSALPIYNANTLLSSIQFTPQKQLGILSTFDAPTWGYSLYGFDQFNPTYTSLAQMQKAPHVDGSGGGDEQLSTFDVLVRHKAKHPYANAGVSQLSGQAQAKLEYVAISALLSGEIEANVISGDTQVLPNTQSSISLMQDSDNKYYQLYNWMGSGDNTHVISASFGATAYFPINGTGAPTDPANAAEILTRSHGLPKRLHYDTYGIKLPKVGPSDITEELYDLILSGGGGTDLSAIKQIVIETLDDPEAKEPLSSNLNDCFWPQGDNFQHCYGSSIGNSAKQMVVSLDDMKLKATGNNSITLDWAGGNATDSTGRQSLTWEGRGLLDSNENWTVLWDICQLWDNNNVETLDWAGKALIGNWKVSQGNFTIENGKLVIGQTELTEAKLQQLLRLVQ